MKCMFCEETEPEMGLVRCTNADVAAESGWEDLYHTQGFLDVPFPSPDGQSCFWYVPRR